MMLNPIILQYIRVVVFSTDVLQKEDAFSKIVNLSPKKFFTAKYLKSG